MIHFQVNTLFWLLLFAGLQGCSNVAVIKSQGFNLAHNQPLINLTTWSFQGRLAVKSKTDSWVAAIDWQHQLDQDVLKLAGPLGYGTVLVRLTATGVSINHSDGRMAYSADPDQLIAENLGLFVPVSALKFWVLGLVQTGIHYELINNGFKQLGWSVSYPLSMQVDKQLMPHKMRLNKDELQLKLVFDQWQLNAEK